ncbi:hypothetical protein H8356DRAFT_1381017 [Neocallimastix lanati (nom. inval.)]|nr:hypothetical protein H8356DRAFT_1381017 [Neocallimastix sp. JGI-2020a]
MNRVNRQTRLNQQIVINENNDINNKGINFNYSESFNRIVELTSDNYVSWKNNMLLRNLSKDILGTIYNDYIDDKFDNTLVYDKETNLLDIKNDIIVKWILLNTLDSLSNLEHIRKNLSLVVWRKETILKFNEDQDINIFMATLQNTIEEYESIDHDIEDSIKAGILNRALPENLRFINVLSNYVKDVIPDIKFSNMKEHTKIENSQKHIFLTEKVQSSVKYKAKSGKCYMCGRFGHYINECPLKDSFKYKKLMLANTLSKDYNTEDTSLY